MTQRRMMRELVRKLGEISELVVRAYAEAERMGRVNRSSNLHGLTPEEYGQALCAMVSARAGLQANPRG
jgi:hypothetical protein